MRCEKNEGKTVGFYNKFIRVEESCARWLEVGCVVLGKSCVTLCVSVRFCVCVSREEV